MPLEKRIFAVTLTKRAMVLDGHADKETERIALEDRRKFIRFGLDLVFVITQHNDAGFGTMWEESSSRLIVRTHIVGIAQGVPFSWSARYPPRAILR
jgi:hypothetical protein